MLAIQIKSMSTGCIQDLGIKQTHPERKAWSSDRAEVGWMMASNTNPGLSS